MPRKRIFKRYSVKKKAKSHSQHLRLKVPGGIRDPVQFSPEIIDFSAILFFSHSIRLHFFLCLILRVYPSRFTSAFYVIKANAHVYLRIRLQYEITCCCFFLFFFSVLATHPTELAERPRNRIIGNDAKLSKRKRTNVRKFTIT